jgi:hypothetical protein
MASSEKEDEEFKVGDRVRVVSKEPCSPSPGWDADMDKCLGNVYTIKCPAGSVRLKWFKLKGVQWTFDASWLEKANQPKTTKKGEIEADEIDQEEVCSFCRDRNEWSESYHCEGRYCGEAHEAYLEENNLTIKKGVSKMNKNIATVYADNTVTEGNMVEKHFGGDRNADFIAGLVMKHFSKEILAEAKRLEKEEKEAAKSCK